MASRKTGRAMYPINLHVSEAHDPGDTVQSRLPDPERMEQWLNQQICFDEGQENRADESILRKLGPVSGGRGLGFETLRELHRNRQAPEALAGSSTGSLQTPGEGPQKATCRWRLGCGHVSPSLRAFRVWPKPYLSLYYDECFGAVAQLGERRVRNAKVGSSILLRSTKQNKGLGQLAGALSGFSLQYVCCTWPGIWGSE